VLTGGMTDAVYSPPGSSVACHFTNLGPSHQRRPLMPIVEVTLVNGRSPEELRAMISAVTTAVSETVAAPFESIRVHHP